MPKDWKPVDINDPRMRSGCRECAEQIHQHLGGDAAGATIHTIEPKYPAPYLGGFRGSEKNVWRSHDVVVKEGKVYYLTTGHTGLGIEEYKSLWSNRTFINFPF